MGQLRQVLRGLSPTIIHIAQEFLSQWLPSWTTINNWERCQYTTTTKVVGLFARLEDVYILRVLIRVLTDIIILYTIKPG